MIHSFWMSFYNSKPWLFSSHMCQKTRLNLFFEYTQILVIQHANVKKLWSRADHVSFNENSHFQRRPQCPSITHVEKMWCEGILDFTQASRHYLIGWVMWCTHRCTSTHAGVHTQMHMRARTHTFTHTHTHTHTHTLTHTFTNTHTQKNTHTPMWWSLICHTFQLACTVNPHPWVTFSEIFPSLTAGKGKYTSMVSSYTVLFPVGKAWRLPCHVYKGTWSVL